jgi:hypothetical protein
VCFNTAPASAGCNLKEQLLQIGNQTLSAGYQCRIHNLPNKTRAKSSISGNGSSKKCIETVEMPPVVVEYPCQ